MKTNPALPGIRVEKLSLFSFSSSGRYIKTWTDWFQNAMPSVSLRSR